ncbi:putative N-acetyltransferase YafP [Planctomycetes bacterium CA13]|uniref:Putative N-acetyltransferase YafP n=1 Tax=Novipirellula herctigrandis TaxID=2527986 RepID=A0A5C5ZBR0_9BACT|nr:putative N-acetyltransferase YafP [Planctomycetes bacterium CA13]
MYQIRLYRTDDADALLSLFRDTVFRVNCRDYTPQQLEAWAPAEVSLDAWRERFNNRVAIVIETDAEIAGFADMTLAGHLDRLFVSADHQRRGVGKMLVDELKIRASELGIADISTDASITARPFFVAQGFTVVRQQSVLCREQQLMNFKMQFVANV